MADIPGWYVDAMEQNIGQLVVRQREKQVPVQGLIDYLLEPEYRDQDGKVQRMTDEEHRKTLAVCFAICIQRLSKVDVR